MTKDPEIRKTSTGKSISTFSLAVDKQGGDGANFFDCECWEKTADLTEKLLNKGSLVLVSGSLKQNSWEDKESGQKRSKVVVSIYSFNALDKKDVEPKSEEVDEAIDKNTYDNIPF